MRPARGDYPCSICDEVKHSPGALGGHMAHHRRLGDLPSIRTPKLSGPQQALLDELRENGGLYITRHSRWHRTIMALSERGLARIDQPDYSTMGQDHWVAVDRVTS